MASLVRRLQIRHLKRQGFVRTRFRLVRDPVTRRLEPRPVNKGGLILDPKGEPIGYHWPQRIPAVG